MWVLDWDEWYPVYSIEERDLNPYDYQELDIDEDFVNRYNRVMDEFNELQNDLDRMRRRRNGS